MVVQRVDYPSEGPLLAPTLVLSRRDAGSGKKMPVVVILSAAGKEALAAETGPGSPRALAQAGSLVLLPDLRTYGEMFATSDHISQPGGIEAQRVAWERNGIVWGRPVPAMGCTDLCGILDAVLPPAKTAWPNADAGRVSVIVRGSPGLAIAALFATALNPPSARPTWISPSVVSRNATCRWFPMSCVTATCFNGQPWRPIAN